MEIPCAGKASEIYTRLKTKFEAYQRSGKLDQWIKDLDFNDGACKATATGPGFKSKIECKDGRIVIDLDLGLLLKPLRAKIEDGIRTTIEKAMKA